MNTCSSIVDRPTDRELIRSTQVVALTAVLLLGVAAPARGEISPGEAFEAYRRGNFEKSREQYSRLAKEKPDDPRLRFNAGAAAYRLNDLTNAATWFESVLGQQDLRLQQQAYYNLGNTRYRLGEALPDPEARRRLWSEALTNFVSAIKLDQSDTNAAANYSYVRQQLEQLERQLPPPQPQQGQQQKQPQDQKPSDSQQDSPSQHPSDSQDSQDNKSQQSQSQSKSKDQDSRDPSQDNPSENGNQGKGSGEDQDADPAKESQGAKPGEGKQDAQKLGESKSGTGKEGDSGAAEEGDGPDGEMTPAQAVQMLESQKGEEKALMFRAYGNGKEAAERAARIRKPW
jgi:Ca-activated chloride channel family protein